MKTIFDDYKGKLNFENGLFILTYAAIQERFSIIDPFSGEFIQMQIHRDVIFSSAKSMRYEFIVQHVKTLLKPQSTPDRGPDFRAREIIVRKK